MKKSKHTPGPWEAGDGVILCADPDMAIGSVFPCDRDKSAHGTGFTYGEVTKANARLIAAAPELLEAAQRSAAALRSGGIAPSATSDNPLEWLLHQTEAAIAKATGESA